MSVSSSGSITFSGLASGVDTQSIIQSMMKLAQQPITQLQSQQTVIQTKQAAVQQLVSALQALSSSAQSLSSQSAFQAVTASSSTPATATVTTSPGAQQGVYSLIVNGLATSQKLASTAQTDTTSALNLNGTFVINGKAVAVASSDSLTSIAQSINSAGAGVTASLINGGTGNAFLTLTSNTTGANGAIQFSDVSGNVLSSLGVASGAASIRQPVTDGAIGTAFGSSTSSIGSQLGLSSGTSGSFTVNGTSVNVDYSTDSLQDVANAINAANAGATASVVSSTSNGSTTYQLQIVGASGSTPTFTDPSNLLGAVGILQSGAGNQLIGAQDASFSLDGVALTSSSNTVTSAIPGVTLTLLSGSSSSPATSTISLQTDTDGISKNVQSFVSAYNSIVSYISQTSQLDTSTFQSGPLFGDFTTQQVQSQLSGMLFSDVPGLSGSFKNLASLGFSLDKSGNLAVDSGTLNNALATNPQAVANLFAASGTSNSADIQYVSSSTSTQPSSTPYAVNITQAATQGSYTGAVAQTGASGSGEVLTFTGKSFGSGYTLNVDSNSTQAQIISQINNDATLKNYVSASSVGGVLTLTAKQYGTNGNFSVSSNQAAAATNSGIGTNGQGTSTNGLDVAGTINGEAATGTGQYLAGNNGNATTANLQIQYKGTATGAVGSITFSSGVGTEIQGLVTKMTDPTSGFVTEDINSYTTQINDINDQITNLQNQLTQQQQQLTQEFANMEAMIAQYQQQGTALASFGLSSSSSSGSSSKASIGSSHS